MGKPRATRKQPIALSSDDEEDARNSPPLKRPRKGTLLSVDQDGGRSKSRATRSQTRRSASPQHQVARLVHKASTKSPSKSPAKPKPKTKPITSFFGKATLLQARQSSADVETTARTPPEEDLDDIFNTSDEDVHAKPRPSLALRRKDKDVASQSHTSTLKGSQKFFRSVPANSARAATPSSQNSRVPVVDQRPWNEKYGPVTLDELAVHKKKVADVRTWLTNVFDGKERKRLLLLKGPAGCGKTTTMALLTRELDVEMHEWKNPNSAAATSDGFVSITAQFEDFVGRTGAFGSLSFDGNAITPQPEPTATSARKKQLILVEEFPNTFARASNAVQSFRNSVLHYLAANTPSASALFASKFNAAESVTPIVMIISETLLSTNTAAADSFTAHRLLGPEILSHPGVTVIDFNAIAPTFMTKALEQIIVKEARKSGRKRSAGPQVVQRLAELGDIRNAASSLEFLCLRGDADGDWSSKTTATKKKGSKETPMTKMEQESLEMVTQRENTLGIFHAVGKIVYNKRIAEAPSGPDPPQPPHWFPERRRSKASEVNVDILIDELGTDTQTFIAALHENYVLSCQGADSEETAESIEGCVDALSDADLLSVGRFNQRGPAGRNFQGTSTDSLRQDEMSFQTSARGLLYHLPSPVKRAAPPSGVMGLKSKGPSKGSAYVMYWPSSLRLWKQQEEIGGMLDLWVSRAQRGEPFSPRTTDTKPIPSTSGGGGVDTWKKSTSQADVESGPPVLLGSGGSARNEMLLERLPYLPRILRRNRMPDPSTAATVREIAKITSFTGRPGASDEQDDEEDDAGEQEQEQEQWATDQPETPRKRRRIGIARKKGDVEDPLAAVAEESVGRLKLVLSDDDIED